MQILRFILLRRCISSSTAASPPAVPSSISRGDFVDVRRNGRAWQGLVIGSSPTISGRWEMINFMHMNNQLITVRETSSGSKQRRNNHRKASMEPPKPFNFEYSDVIFRIPRFCQNLQKSTVDPSQINETCSKSLDKCSKADVESAVPLMDAFLRGIHGVVGNNPTTDTAPTLWKRLHSQLIESADPTDYSVDLQTASVALKLLANNDIPPPIVPNALRTVIPEDQIRLYWTLIHLIRRPIFFIPLLLANESQLITSLRFICRHPDEITEIQRLQQHFMQRDSIYSQFFHKSRQIINENKKLSTGPFVADSRESTNLDSQDRRWIDALLALAATDRRFGMNGSAYGFLGKAILGPLFYETDFNGLSRFLTDLGVWRQWDCLPLMPVIHRSPDSWRSRHRERSLYRRSLSDNAQTAESVGMTTATGKSAHSAPMVGKTRFQDSWEAIRQDFSGSTAYSIDDFTVGEVDDALSIEWSAANGTTASAGEDSPWIHIHIADPTALIQSSGGVAEYARMRSQTTYFAEHSIPMIPEEIASTLGGSLEPDQPVNRTLTVSVRINQRGEVYDYKIQPGVLGSLKKLSYDDVDQWLISSSAADKKYSSQFALTPDLTANGGVNEWAREYLTKWRYCGGYDNGTLPPTTSTIPSGFTRQLPPESVHDLLLLERFAYLHYRQRSSRSLSLSLPTANVYLQSKHPSTLPHAIGTLPRPDRDDPPVVSISVDEPYESRAKQIVQEYMIIAGKIVAEYASQASLPVPYRIQPAPSVELIEQLHRLKCGSNDKILPRESFSTLSQLPSSQLQTSAGCGHFMLGLNAYCQATSPLRRYSDLLVHWQVKNRLLWERGTTNARRPWISTEEMEIQSAEIGSRERMVKRMQRLNRNHWIMHHLRQQFLAATSSTGSISSSSSSSSSSSIGVPEQYYDAYAINRVVGVNSGYAVFLKQLAYRTFINDGEYFPGESGADRTGQWMRVKISGIDRYNNPILSEVKVY